MPVNWPPPSGTYPPWPPIEVQGVILNFSDIVTMGVWLAEKGFTLQNPTAPERNTFFKNATCDDGHNVVGRMVVSPTGDRRWPFAICNSVADREFLVLWYPYSMGWKSGIE